MSNSGLLLIDKKRGSPSFHLVSVLRRITRIQKIGHAGTLDPFATGVMILLIGKEYTKKSDQFLFSDKDYHAVLHLGIATDTYDLEGQVTARSEIIPTLEQIEKTLCLFQGEILQVPPMFSAKKIKGKKLYDLARKGIVVEREAVLVKTNLSLIRYHYPLLEIFVSCSKGTYIRSLAHDIGQHLGCFAHLTHLTRTRVGPFYKDECIAQDLLSSSEFDFSSHLRSFP